MTEPRMLTRWETIKRTAQRLMPGHSDLEMLVAAGMSVATFVYSLGMVLLRLVGLLVFPLSVLLLYPIMRANHRRWFRWAQEENQRRAALIAELTEQCRQPLEPWTDWKLDAVPASTDDAPTPTGGNVEGEKR